MEFRDRVKSSVDIVKVVGQYVRLKKMGPRYLGLCPFHTEKTPSFHVHGTQQFFKCFGCDAKGDVFSFLEQIEGLTFWEALTRLAEENGIPLPAKRGPVDKDTGVREALFAMHEAAAQVFQANLRGPNGAQARDYLLKRGLTPALAEQFGIGYSERNGQDLVKRFQNYGPAELEASGLVRKRNEGPGYYDVFRDRLMFPIHNESGKVIAFGGRALADGVEPKYYNSPETPIYKKNAVLYNLHRAKDGMRRLDRAVLVEGYMDVIGVFGAGFKPVVASCGTALTPLQVRSIRRHTDHIVVNFDPDRAGAAAAERAIEMLLEEGMNVRIVHLEGGLDPDEYIKQNGSDAYAKKLQQAPGYFVWLADRARQQFDMRTAEGKVEAYEYLLPVIRKITDKLERAAVANEVAEHLGIDRGLVLDEFRKSAVSPRAQKQVKPPESGVSKRERVLLVSLVNDMAVRDFLVPQLAALSSAREMPIFSLMDQLFRLHQEKPDFAYTDLAALDAFGEFDLALTCQQRNGTHFAQVHPDRIIGLIDVLLRQVEFVELFRVVQLLVVFEFGLFEDFDTGGVEVS